MAPHSGRGAVAQTARVVGITGAGIGLASAAGALGAGTHLARLLLTPERVRPEVEEILAVDTDSITLRATEETVVPGRYGLWFNKGQGHLRLGEVIEAPEPSPGWVTRRLEAVDMGIPHPGPARWDGYYYSQSPDRSLWLATHDVLVPSDVGDLAAWLVPGAGDESADAQASRPGRWAILVHGRGATRHECLRAVPTLYRLGITTLVPTYRNDVDGPPSPDGLYNLGLSEWRDTEAAIAYAVEHGADDVVLFGWSMGGAITLQTLDLSPLGQHVSCAVLDSPVIDWADVIAHHARLRKVPPPLTHLATGLMGARWSRRLVGVHEPLDVARTNWQDRADELRHRILLIHSADDEFVPVGPSRELAARRRDLVQYAEWQQARHVKEWNVDAPRWEALVEDYLTRTRRL